MKNSKIILGLVFALASVVALAETKFDSLSYWTNFDDEDVKDDFVPCSIEESKYTGPSANATHYFKDGMLYLEAAYGLKASVALIEGGAQSEDEVLITQVTEMVDGKNVEKPIMGYPYGIYTNTVIQMSYELTIPDSYQHTNLYVYVVSRKNATTGSNFGPHSYRIPYYKARYDGSYLEICEYTYYPTEEECNDQGYSGYFQNPRNVRILARVPASTDSAEGTYTLKFITMGGYDGDDNGLRGQPCNLTAEIKYNGQHLASASAVDYPYNWEKGPDVSGNYVPEFKPTANHGDPLWTYTGGEWERATKRDLESTNKNEWNTDIRIPGWCALGIIHKKGVGSTKHGIKVTNFSVSNIDRSAFENVLIIR
jgi:hypothetical protein